MSYSKSNLTPAKKKFAQTYAKTDNASEAVRVAFPHLTNQNTIKDKGHRLLTNTYVLQDIGKQKERMEAVAGKAVKRIERLIDSGREHSALQASIFAYEQVHGKAKQKIEQSSSHVIVSYDLSGGNAPPIPQEVLDQLK
jgi:phage terminase small subunit